MASMRMIVFVLGVLVAIDGVLMILRPDWLRRALGFWATGYMSIVGALLKLAAGVFMLLAATQCDHTWWIAAIGGLACLQAVAMLAMPQARRKALLLWLQTRSSLMHRIMGLVVIVFGVLIAWAAGIPR